MWSRDPAPGIPSPRPKTTPLPRNLEAQGLRDGRRWKSAALGYTPGGSKTSSQEYLAPNPTKSLYLELPKVLK